MGEKVADLVDATQGEGEYEVAIDVSSIPAGTYYYQVISGPYVSEPQVITIVR